MTKAPTPSTAHGASLNHVQQRDYRRTAQKTGTSSAGEVALVTSGSEPRIDSRQMARHLGSAHQHVRELIQKYRADFEQLGKVRFQTGPSSSASGQSEKFALLNEDQTYLLLTYSKNTPRVRQLKVRLVKAFREARHAAEQRSAEYLPTYHALHDEIQRLVGDSPNARWTHCNFNKLLNRFVGIESGQRRSAGLPVQSLLVVGQAVAERAMRGAADHHEGYQRAKTAMLALSQAAMLNDGRDVALVGGA